MLLKLRVLMVLIILTGCAAKKPVRPPRRCAAPCRATYEPKNCKWVDQDHIRFRCKDVIFNPGSINAKE